MSNIRVLMLPHLSQLGDQVGGIPQVVRSYYMKLFKPQKTDDYVAISEFIEVLEVIRAQYGDIPLIAEYPDYGYHYITLVEIIDNQKLDDDKTIVPKAALLS